jgi:glutathione S-transferase
MRARAALAISGTRHCLREVKLSAKPAAMLAASPKGTVPVLVLADATVIDQSLDIMRWALARHDPDRWLDRDDPDLIALCDGPFKQALDRYKYPNRHGSDPLDHRARGFEMLRTIEAWLARSQVAGFGLADAAIVPFVRQFAGVDRGWFDAQPLPGVQAWLNRFAGSALYAAIMLRLAPWAPGDAPVRLPQAPLP